MLEDEADMMGARGYLQRGLRFCKGMGAIWVEFARLECFYVAKIAARRRILGVDGERKADGAVQDVDEDMLKLPMVTQEDINPSLDTDAAIDEVALQNMENTPALTGAIPMAVFDAAMKEFNHDGKLAEEFFDMAAEFDRSTALDKILKHIVDSMVANKPDNIHTITCQFLLPISGVEVSSDSFPGALATSLATVRDTMKRFPLKKQQIAKSAINRLLSVACTHELDLDIKTALAASLRQYVKTIGGPDEVTPLALQLQEKKLVKEARYLVDIATKVYPSDRKLSAAHAMLEAPKEIVLAKG